MIDLYSSAIIDIALFVPSLEENPKIYENVHNHFLYPLFGDCDIILSEWYLHGQSLPNRFGSHPYRPGSWTVLFDLQRVS